MTTTQIYQAINAVSQKINDVNSRLDSIIQRLDALEQENSQAIFDLAEVVGGEQDGE